eukprot:gene1672-biopygen3339
MVPLRGGRAQSGEALEAGADALVEITELRVVAAVLDDPRGERHLPECGAVAQQSQRNLRVGQEGELVEERLRGRHPRPRVGGAEGRGADGGAVG